MKTNIKISSFLLLITFAWGCDKSDNLVQPAKDEDGGQVLLINKTNKTIAEVQASSYSETEIQIKEDSCLLISANSNTGSANQFESRILLAHRNSPLSQVLIDWIDYGTPKIDNVELTSFGEADSFGNPFFRYGSKDILLPITSKFGSTIDFEIENSQRLVNFNQSISLPQLIRFTNHLDNSTVNVSEDLEFEFDQTLNHNYLTFWVMVSAKENPSAEEKFSWFKIKLVSDANKITIPKEQMAQLYSVGGLNTVYAFLIYTQQVGTLESADKNNQAVKYSVPIIVNMTSQLNFFAL